jgi:hypothetical protein
MADIQNLWGDLIKPEDVRSIGASLGKQAERGEEPSFSASFELALTSLKLASREQDKELPRQLALEIPLKASA